MRVLVEHPERHAAVHPGEVRTMIHNPRLTVLVHDLGLRQSPLRSLAHHPPGLLLVALLHGVHVVRVTLLVGGFLIAECESCPRAFNILIILPILPILPIKPILPISPILITLTSTSLSLDSTSLANIAELTIFNAKYFDVSNFLHNFASLFREIGISSLRI